MSTINTALSTPCSALIYACVRSYNKPLTKPQTSLVNFLPLIGIASDSNWLISLFIISPGYLPEHSGNRGPGERAAHLAGASGWSRPAEITGAKPIGSGFPIPNMGEQQRRGQERGERRGEQGRA